MRKAIMISVLTLLLVIPVVLLCLNKRPHDFKKVEFEYVTSLSKTDELEWDYWFTVRDDNKGTDIVPEIMSNVCDIDSLQMDFDEYTYIFSDGHELVELSYTGSDARGRFGVSPRYYGYATLKQADKEMFYVYRIPCEVPVIKDMHAHYENDQRTIVLP